uniref:Reverse transcriptase domain-containing protein n=1 Tax=Angiostrongylus cantonensis TaxID=6313 RepID=A0A0K0D7A6_ANGCA
MGVEIDIRQLHHFRFASDSVLMTTNIIQAEQRLAYIGETWGKIGLQLNLEKNRFSVKNGLVFYTPFTLNEMNILECFNYVIPGQEFNLMKGLTPKLSRMKRATWGASKSIEDAVVPHHASERRDPKL